MRNLTWIPLIAVSFLPLGRPCVGAEQVNKITNFDISAIIENPTLSPGDYVKIEIFFYGNGKT